MNSNTAARIIRVVPAMLAAAVLGACTTMPSGPAVLVLPGTGKSVDQFRMDDMDCAAPHSAPCSVQRQAQPSTAAAAQVWEPGPAWRWADWREPAPPMFQPGARSAAMTSPSCSACMRRATGFPSAVDSLHRALPTMARRQQRTLRLLPAIRPRATCLRLQWVIRHRLHPAD